jgi:hypothetical protein
MSQANESQSAETVSNDLDLNKSDQDDSKIGL